MKQTNFLVWSGIRIAIPAHLRNFDVRDREREISPGFQCGETFSYPVVCKSKHVNYDLLVSEKQNSQGFC